MPTEDIDLPENEGGPRTPVLKRTAIGQRFVGALVDSHQRDILKDGKPVLKENGKARQELVISLVAIESTMPAGLGEDVDVPEPGAVVRAILKGKSFGDWIEATGSLKPKRRVGDVYTLTTESAIVYDEGGKPTKTLTTQAEVDAVPRGRTVGIYGPLTVRRATAEEDRWTELAQAEYRAATAINLDGADNGAPDDPF